MNYADIPVLSLMKQKMNYLSERQAVLSVNVANADTPGYRAQDVKSPDFGGMVRQAGGSLKMARTNGKHLDGGSANQSMFKAYERADTFETTPNENNVAIEEEIQKMALNQAQYTELVALYRKTTDMFKTAIGRTGA